MPWGAFALALVIVYLLQTAAVRLLGLSGVDLFLAFALFCGLVAPLHDARISGWLIGFSQDLGSGSPMGLHAFALGIVAYFITVLRGVVNLQIWWARLIVALLAALPGQLVLAIHERYWQQSGVSLWGAIGQAFALSVVAALIAGLFTQLPMFLGWDRRRRHYPRARW